MSPQTSNGPEIRTYRGRNLEELIPRIREELGPDAIILREREGLMGGINGFFAQRCVEVDVQAPGGPVPPGVDFYDAEDDALPGAEDPWAQTVHEGGELEPSTVNDSAYAASAAAYVSGGGAQAVEELSFAERLARARSERDAAVTAAAPAAPERSVADELAALAQPAQRPEDPAAPAQPAQRPDEPIRQTERGPTPTPYPAGVRAKVRVRPKSVRPAPGIVPGASHPDPAAFPPDPAASQPDPAASQPDPAASQSDPAAARAASQLDPVAAGAVARELIAGGIGQAWAHELIVSASAHLTPFAPHGSLRDAVRAGLARGISAPPLLPSSGAAVAFVGAGGAGKSRCVAAMAAAYARASTLRVTALALGDAGTLPAGRGIDVPVLRGGTAAEAVARGRDHGLVVLDTPATSPVDATGIAALAQELAPLALDAVYLTLPATLSASAARDLLDGLTPLAPTALAITHADETGALGIAAELAYQTGVPIAFVHEVVGIESALHPADPAGVAERILGTPAGAGTLGSLAARDILGTPEGAGTPGGEVHG